MKKKIFISSIYLVVLIIVHCINFGDNLNNFYKLKNKNMLQHEKVDSSKIRTISNNNYAKKNEMLNHENDFIGNLYIEKANFVSSIVQTNDNSFYLNHNINKEKSEFGTPFLDYRTKLDDKKLIIYGNNSSSVKQPFKVFENYYDKSYYENHKYIYLDTVDELRKYEIFSVYVETENLDYTNLNFSDEKQYFNYLNNLKNNSLYETSARVYAEDEILIIQTYNALSKYENYNKNILLVISKLTK